MLKWLISLVAPSRRLTPPIELTATPPLPLWYANASLAALHRTLASREFIDRPAMFQRMAMDAAHVTFGDITSHEWRHDWPIGGTITIRLPQRYQAGA